ncbi:transposase [Streptomyces seoulensis]|nr:transposase [Streptomyces seoulensis]
MPATYRRTHGVTYFHGCHSVGDDRLWGIGRRCKGALKSIRAARPDDAPICIILDNLSAHTGVDIRRWAKKNKVELCFTPTYASWANPIEAHFGPLRQFTLADSHHRSHPAQTRALHRYLCWRNANARHPDVLAAQRKERARIRSEKGIRWGGEARQTATRCWSRLAPIADDQSSGPQADRYSSGRWKNAVRGSSPSACRSMASAQPQDIDQPRRARSHSANGPPGDRVKGSSTP